MNAQRLLQTVSAILYKNLPPGLNRADVRAFLHRNQAGLLAVIEAQYERMCRLNALLPGIEHRIGHGILPPDSPEQVAVFGRDVGSSSKAILAVKARCHPQDPQVLRQFAVHSRREDERTWRLHPGSSWEGNESEAIRAFLNARLHELRWWEGEAGFDDEGSWEGAEDGSIVLEDRWVQRTAAELLKEQDSDDERTRKEREKQQADYEDWKRQASAKQTARSGAAEPPSGQELPVSPTGVAPTDVASTGVASTGVAPTGVAPSDVALSASAESAPWGGPIKTPWGGVRGAGPLDCDAIVENSRVVTRAGLHGVVRKALVYTFTTSRLSFHGSGVGTSEPTREKRHEFTVRLDSGRTIDTGGPLFEELAKPTAVVPDISFDEGKTWLAPDEAWKAVQRGFDNIGYYQKKAQDARKRQNKDQFARGAEKARLEFNARMQVFADWRLAHPDVAIEGLDLLVERRLQLEAQVKGLGRRMFGQGYRDEVQWLSSAPPDWRTRFQPGDNVIVPNFYEERKLETTDDRIARIEGDKAYLASGGAPVVLFYLRLDTQAEPPSIISKPRYLVQLASDLLAPAATAGGGEQKPSASRGVFSRAIKSYLSGHAIPVRTEVERGAWISSIRLQPPERGRWTPEMVSRLNTLLPGLRARDDEATFHPWATEGRAGDLMVDDFGTPSGILLPPEQATELASHLAKALNDEGMALSREGEAWLRVHNWRNRSGSGTTGGSSVAGTTRGGATAEQRQASADGCADISFTVEGYGLVRVVCGQAGRRDVWHNVHTRNGRFGFNGGRWARGQRPPEDILRAIRERGITAFDSTTERLEAPAPYGVDLHLNAAPLTALLDSDSAHKPSNYPILEQLPDAGETDGDYLDPVVEQVVYNGGLRSGLIADIAPELRGRARAIPGLLRDRGKTWLELAQIYYGPETKVVEGEAPFDAWPETEGTSSFIEVFNYGLDYCVVEGVPTEDDGAEDLEYLCACDRSPRPDAGRSHKQTTASGARGRTNRAGGVR